MYDDDGEGEQDHGDTEDEDDLAKELEGGDTDTEGEDDMVDLDEEDQEELDEHEGCLLYTSPSPRDRG